MAIAAEEMVQPVGGPPLPMGRRVELPGRGTTFVREVDGPPGAPTVVLLHGWLASAGLNWFQAFDDLGANYRVLAPDLRGHGRGIRDNKRFTLADCADDVAVLLDELGTGPAIVVGYSLGGPVAQLLWKRHRRHVDGLVLCATSHYLMPGMREQMIFATMMLAAAGTTRLGMLAAQAPVARLRQLIPVNPAQRPERFRDWARAEMGRHDYRHLLEAGVAMSNYHAKWVSDIDVPTAVVVTTRDRAVNPLAQATMAFRIPGASIHRIDDGHITCARPGFGRPIAAAVADVAARAGARRATIDVR
jgi:pimeloyl-ACP methyl ester carboxylesterase